METAQFLTVGVGARGLGMGGAFTALADDAHAIYWNPAGLAALGKREAVADDAELATSARLNFLVFAQPTGIGTFGAAATYLSQPALEGRDLSGHPTNDFHAADFAGAVAFARRTDLVDLGASLKFVQSRIGAAQAQTAAVDAGARRAIAAGPGRVVLGLAVRNAGPGMRFDAQTNELPLRVAVGAAYEFAAGHALAFEAVNGPRVVGTDFGVGGELQAVRRMFLRAGWTTLSSNPGGAGLSAVSGLTLGVGAGLSVWRFDYAVVPSGELGTAHRFSFATRW